LDTTNDWQPRPLGELIRLQKGVSYKGEFLDKPGPWLLGLGTIALGGGLMLDKARTYSGPIRDSQRASPGDLILAVVGITPEGSVIGSPALIPPTAVGEFAVTHHVARAEVISKDSADVRFLYYLLRDREFADYVRGVQYGSTVPAVSIPDVLSYEAGIPPLPEQRAIARVLGSLDDKIELNRRMNQSLEEICRALFKFWFVDFGPVRAKAEGRWKKGESLPGMPADMWDLWPSEFVESEIGEIPRGWACRTFQDVLHDLESGSRPTGGASENVDGAVPSIGAENVLGLGRYDYGKTRYVPRTFFEELKRGVLRPGDVLLYKDGAQIGRRSYLDEGFPFEECCVNEHVFILRAHPPLTQRYLYFWLDQDWMAEEIVSRNAGSAQPGLNQPAVYGLPVVVPSDGVIGAFDSRVAPLTQRIFSGQLESRTLGQVRDALLPKLLSGEIRVRGRGTQ
jgi:type I restriction enzyme S subunit